MSLPNGIRVQVGRCYITREGQTVGPMTTREAVGALGGCGFDQSHPFWDGAAGYTKEGRWGAFGLHPRDLVAEVAAPEPVAPPESSLEARWNSFLDKLDSLNEPTARAAIVAAADHLVPCPLCGVLPSRPA